jgi:hypothetical protein
MNKQVEVENLNNEILNSINLDDIVLSSNDSEKKMYMSCYGCSSGCGSYCASTCSGYCEGGSQYER